MNRFTAPQLRALAATVVVTLVAAALMVDYWTQRALPESPISLGILELRLAFNRGMAFSMGNSLPVGVVVALTASITAGLAVYGWRTAARSGPLTTAAVSLILAGALSNVLDRLLDGAVTDYFHTGWWPTFNLADTYITCGVVLMIGAALFTRETQSREPRPPRPTPAHETGSSRFEMSHPNVLSRRQLHDREDNAYPPPPTRHRRTPGGTPP